MPSLTGISNADIRKGDIIFYVKLGERGNKLTFDIEQSAHVAIVVSAEGKGKKATINIAHATRPHNPSKPKAVLVEKLVVPSHLFSYVVYRHPINELAQKAADIAYAWASPADIKYDDTRLEKMENLLKENSVSDALIKSKKEFSDSGYWRALKFTIRAQKPIGERGKHGFRCDQFAILCYQVAATTLKLPDYIKKLPIEDHKDITSVSLKHYNPNLLDKKSPLLTYYETKFSHSNYDETRDKTAPVIVGLHDNLQNEISKNNGNIFEQHILPLDAKLCSPSVLLEFLMGNNDGGDAILQPIGIVVGKPKEAPSSSASQQEVAVEEARYINSNQDIHYSAAIQKAVINILLTQILSNEPDNNLISQVIEHCPNHTPREKLLVYLNNYLLRNYLGNDQYSMEYQVALQCIRNCLEKNDNLIFNLERNFIPAQIKKPIYLPSVSSS